MKFHLYDSNNNFSFSFAELKNSFVSLFSTYQKYKKEKINHDNFEVLILMNLIC
jgi:hypothetical protein